MFIPAYRVTKTVPCHIRLHPVSVSQSILPENICGPLTLQVNGPLLVVIACSYLNVMICSIGFPSVS